MKLLTPTDLSALTGKTWRTIKKRLGDARIAPTKRGRKSDSYASDLALAAIYSAADGGATDLSAARTRLAREQADAQALKNEQQRGGLVHLEVVERELSQAISVFRINMMGLPTQLAPQLVGLAAAEIQSVLERELRRMCQMIADYDFSNPRDG